MADAYLEPTMSKEPRRKSRRLNPNMPTDAVYAVDPALEALRGAWPGKRPAGALDWMTVFDEGSDHFADLQLVDKWRSSGHARPANRLVTQTLNVHFPPTVDAELRRDLVTYLQASLGVVCAAMDNVLVDEPQFFLQHRAPRHYGPQLDAEAIIDAMPEASWNAVVTEYDLALKDMNFVFGLSSFYTPACVMSACRWLEEEPPALFRGLAHTLVHEVAHNFWFVHCTVNECIMNGHNSMGEAEKAPADFCPQCLSKIKQVRRPTKLDLDARYRTLAEVSRRRGLEKDAAFLETMNSLLTAA